MYNDIITYIKINLNFNNKTIISLLGPFKTIESDEYRIDLELDTIGKREILEPKIRKRKRLIVDRDNNIITIRNNNNNAQNIGQNRNNFGHNNMCADCAIF